MKISFDFDGCLDQLFVQEIAKTFIIQKHEVFIISSRDPKHTNKDVFDLCDKIGLNKQRVFFVDIHPKGAEIIRLGIDIHFENDFLEFIELKGRGLNCILMDTTNLEFFKKEMFDFEN